MPELLMGSDERLPVVAKSVDAEPLVCGAQPARPAAAALAAFFRKTLPPHLLGEWRMANRIADLPMYDALVEALIDRGLLVPPADGVGAEGCWLTVEPAPAQQAR